MASSSTTLTTTGPGKSQSSLWQRIQGGDEIAMGITFLCAFSILAITAYLVWELWINSAIPRHKFGFDFLKTQTWDPVSGDFGALPFVYGTLVTSAVALVIAVPLGVGSAVFLAELAPPALSDALAFMIELLAAVPSVIYGLLGIFILVPALRVIEPYLKAVLGWTPLFSGPFYGVSLFSAGVVLSVMIVPFIISISREVIRAVPNDQREAALALGATRWETVWDAVLPFAKKGIAGSIFLALARSLGETMAVTMVVGNDPKIKASLLAPGYSIAAVIANEFTEATGELYTQSLIELGLVLFALTVIINGAARIMMAASERGKV